MKVSLFGSNDFYLRSVVDFEPKHRTFNLHVYGTKSEQSPEAVKHNEEKQ